MTLILESRNRRRSLRALPLALVAPALILGSCSTDDGAESGPGRVSVVAAFYPLAYLAERIGGTHVAVTTLTRPGGEPHDLELTPKDVGTVVDADLVVYQSRFQPAVDDAVAEAPEHARLDVRRSADLTLTMADEDDASSQVPDPHFWLDPVRYAQVATTIGDALAVADPDHLADYRANLAELRHDLEGLDDDFATSLASCTQRSLVTSHTAFGYLAERYDLDQRGIAGLSPDAEPNPAALADAAKFARSNNVTTIYFETLVSPAIAETLAEEVGATTAVLDPLEGLAEDAGNEDYLSVMRANLATLVAGQSCS